MGLFSTVLHIYERSQAETLKEVTSELKKSRGLSTFTRVTIDDSNCSQVIQQDVFDNRGVFYLITPKIGRWTTIVELNVNINNPFYLYELTNALSRRLITYALSFHLHDDDVLLYNLDYKGTSIDGYNSNYQYFLTEPADRDEIISQRHEPATFADILPKPKTYNELEEILNEGYWSAFDNDDLDEDGVPDDDKYFIDEQDRFERIGKYLEIYSPTEYPFADWLNNISKLHLHNCYLLKADR